MQIIKIKLFFYFFIKKLKKKKILHWQQRNYANQSAPRSKYLRGISVKGLKNRNRALTRAKIVFRVFFVVFRGANIASVLWIVLKAHSNWVLNSNQLINKSTISF